MRISENIAMCVGCSVNETKFLQSSQNLDVQIFFIIGVVAY